MSSARIKAVRIVTPAGDVLNYKDVSRVFTNGNRTVTVMKGSNVPAVVKGLPFSRVSYTYYPPAN